MPHSKALANLQAAIVAENATAQISDAGYVLLLDKIVSYQNGVGEPPTDQEFAAWRDAARHRADMRAIGLVKTAQEPAGPARA